MKNIETSYTFNAAAKTITCADFAIFGLSRILLIVNVTRGTVIYNPSNTATNGTLSGAVLTLTFNTASHSNSDVLQIFTDDGDTGATEQTLMQLTMALMELVSRLQLWSDSSGNLRVNLSAGTGAASVALSGGTVSVTTLGASSTNADLYLNRMLTPIADQQNSLFPVT